MAIRERAKEASEQILAFANRKAGAIRAEGDAAAAAQYAKFEENWQLAAYLRRLESLKAALQGRTIFLLDSAAMPGIGYFDKGPSLPQAGELKPTSVPAGAGAGDGKKPKAGQAPKAGTDE